MVGNEGVTALQTLVVMMLAPDIMSPRGLLSTDYDLLYSVGDMPTCSLKYFPIKLWLGKFMSIAICLMLLREFLICTRSSITT